MKLGASHVVAVLLGAAGVAGVEHLTAPDPGGEARQLRLVNMEVAFRSFEDGGVHASYRACGHLERASDAGAVRLGEPCWRGDLRNAEALIKGAVEDGVKAVQADKVRWP